MKYLLVCLCTASVLAAGYWLSGAPWGRSPGLAVVYAAWVILSSGICGAVKDLHFPTRGGQS